MEFELLLTKAISDNNTISDLKHQLEDIQEQCWNNSTSDEELDLCSAKTNGYVEYLREYSQQFKETGVKMCKESMATTPSLEQKVKFKDECIKFYIKSIPIFEHNVISKLKSLVEPSRLEEL